MPKSTPLLFSARMVRATLNGIKTQTRRVVNEFKRCAPGELHDAKAGIYPARESGFIWYPDSAGLDEFTKKQYEHGVMCRYGAVGDRLWVRETVWLWGKQAKNGKTATGRQKYQFVPVGQHVRYVADLHEAPLDRIDGNPAHRWIKRPAIFMPRWACRIEREITALRVERLQAISEKDAQLEGLELEHACPPPNYFRKNFAYLWDTINAARGFGWAVNPFVWVIEAKGI